MKKIISLFLFFPLLSFAQSSRDTVAEKNYADQGMRALSSKDYQESIEYYTLAIGVNPNKALYYANRASAKWDLKDNEAAIKDYKLAIKLNTKYSWVYYNDIGLVKMSENDYHGARDAYTESIKLYSNGPTFNNRALAELAFGDYDAAVKDFSVAIAHSPKFKGRMPNSLFVANQYFYRAKAEILHKDTRSAISDLDTAVSVDPELAPAYNVRGEVKNTSGDKDGACADWQTASKLGNDDAKENITKYCGK